MNHQFTIDRIEQLLDLIDNPRWRPGVSSITEERSNSAQLIVPHVRDLIADYRALLAANEESSE